MDEPTGSITTTRARTAMNNYRCLLPLEQQFVGSIWLPTRNHDVPDELVSMIIGLLFERTAPSDYVKAIHLPAQQLRQQQQQQRRLADSHQPSSRKRVRISQVDAWKADEKDDDETLAWDSDNDGESEDDDGEEWAKVHALHLKQLAKQDNKPAKQLLDKHLSGVFLSEENSSIACAWTSTLGKWMRRMCSSNNTGAYHTAS